MYLGSNHLSCKCSFHTSDCDKIYYLSETQFWHGGGNWWFKFSREELSLFPFEYNKLKAAKNAFASYSYSWQFFIINWIHFYQGSNHFSCKSSFHTSDCNKYIASVKPTLGMAGVIGGPIFPEKDNLFCAIELITIAIKVTSVCYNFINFEFSIVSRKQSFLLQK